MEIISNSFRWLRILKLLSPKLSTNKKKTPYLAGLISPVWCMNLQMSFNSVSNNSKNIIGIAYIHSEVMR